MVVLLLAPLASGLTPELPDETYSPAKGEHVLVLNEGVWTSQRWSMLEDQGVQPLRNIHSDALLVWADEARVSWPSWVTVEPSEMAQFREPLATESTPQHFRVLLEPRLPSSGIEAVQSALAHHGLSIHSTSLDVGGSLPGSFTVHAPNAMALQPLLQTDGVLWIEPVLTTKARNAQASALMEAGTLDHHPFWSLGLNASGVVLGVADSGIDADHACFRNATSPASPHAESDAAYPAVGIFGEEHRKILHLNTSVDGNDTPGHSDYRHGTHVIGSLACHHIDNFRQGQAPSNGSTLAHGSTLVIQDIVSADGWAPPPVDQLLWESSSHGGVIHSNSWGDDTTAYTERTGRFDAYAKAMPWSVAFVAPGNGGEGVLEPANGRNVVAVSASTKSLQGERWGSTAYGPTETGTDGIFVLAPGTSIQSAGGDGFWDTNNANLRSSSGTSMATPLAAGAAGIIQQLYEGGWIVPTGEDLATRKFSGIQPAWVDDVRTDSVRLGDGFTPSGSLIRASLAMAASPLSENVRNGGNGGHDLHNPYDGWGALNLSQLFDPTTLVSQKTPSHDMWVHDSFQLKSGTVDDWFAAYGGETSNLSGMLANPWYGNESIGPFLQTGDVFTQRLLPLAGENVRIRLAYPAQPEPAMVDDLQLRIRLEDGTILLSDQLREGESAPTKFYPGVVDTNNTTAFPPSNETVHGIDIPWSYLADSSYIDVDVVARFVQPGGIAGAVGLDGDSVGFSLLVKGVDRNSRENLDDDGDGIRNKDDACPNEAAINYWDDTNGDGCLDDDDGDGIPNTEDMCPGETAHPQWDSDRDGCLDDDDGDGVPNIRDVCPTVMAAAQDDVDRDGCIDQDEEEWKILIHAEGCWGCVLEVNSIVVKVDGAKLHEPSWDPPLLLGGDVSSWQHMLSEHAWFNAENFEEVELEIDMKFGYITPTTSGRQFNWFDPVPTFTGPYTFWNVDFQLDNGIKFNQEHVATVSSSSYYLYNTFHKHTFTWSKEPVIDIDGDGYGLPGLTYRGQCTEGSAPVSYQQDSCVVERYNINDAYPADGTQWADTDRDGYGDNASGTNGDFFPNDPSEWSDGDGDGYGDNSDACPNRVGEMSAGGCPDRDGDGYPDVIDDYGRAWGYNQEIYNCYYPWWGCTNPDNEAASMAIDGDYETKYLNFGKYRTGIIITPQTASIVTSIEFLSADDEWARDPTSFHLYGTNETIKSRENSKGESEEWTVISTGEIDHPIWERHQVDLVHFENTNEYRSYKLIFPTVKGDYNAMQIAEIQFFNSSGAPLFTPGDAVIAVHDPPSNALMLHAGQSYYHLYGQPMLGMLRTDVCPDAPGEATLGGGVGCPDEDRDGWADPSSGPPFVEEDMCPSEFGEATTSTGRGCWDEDGDGWADFEDDLPDDDRYHLDSDGDGVADEEDDYPYNALLAQEESVAAFGCFVLIGGVAFVLYKTGRDEDESPSMTMAPEPIVIGQLEEEDAPVDNDTFW